jgi:hypothetical protein
MTTLSNRKAHFMAPSASASFPAVSPWIAEEPAASSAPARDLQSQLKSDLSSGRLKRSPAPAAYSPARGLLIAAVPSVALWWGIVSAIAALTHHAH